MDGAAGTEPADGPGGRASRFRFLIRDRAGQFTEAFDAVLAERWAGRLADMLEEHPDAEADLQTLVRQIQATLPSPVVLAADHAVAAGRDMKISAASGGVAAGVIHGNVAPLDPTRPDLAST